MLTYSICHWVRSQCTHRVNFSPLAFSVQVYQRYCLSQVKYGAPNHNTAMIRVHIGSSSVSGGGIWCVFPGKASVNSEKTMLSMIRFGLPVSVTVEGSIIHCFDRYIFLFIEIGPRINTKDIRRINCQLGQKRFDTPIIGVCTEATKVMHSLCSLNQQCTKLMLIHSAVEDVIRVTRIW